ncbi:hypothetical protein [Haloactinomyces albus]|uniref:Uncharacterized protein n=1 Tax=Haloactinomyces albus TaxID=1352928 RepID=A0AAE3ZJ39_9ACTN|nr:hypothetical protein [Haloactinomyces albus]MDR7304610.1 hypothetical protein [Haloactinomyces albus]
MRTPPRVTRQELEAAVQRIHSRRSKVDDQNRELLGNDPASTLDYLRKYTDRDIPSWVRQADVADCLILHVWTWWEDRRRERALLRAGLREGMFLSQLGAPLGISSRQGVRDALDRLEALLEYDRPDEKITRDARRVKQSSDARQAWIDDNLDEVRTAAARLLAYSNMVTDEDTEWFEELQADYEADAWTPASLTVLGLASGELRASPVVCELDEQHAVHRALRYADGLRSAFSTIRKTNPNGAG